ncbi:MAG: response regulator, partial [Lachnospiraceae bacterium]|nr:response regulator [Lachnospiraceae bacterium]
MEFKRKDAENVLILDDVVSNLMTLADIVREAGYIARPVPAVELAMKAVEAELPDIILMDITMPQMNGYEYCRLLKKDVKTRDIPVIFVSGLSAPADRIKGYESGAVDYITKPFERTDVLMSLKTHLHNFELQKELLINNKKLHRLVNQQVHQIEDERKNMALA